MNHQTVGYIRVSTVEQNVARQLEGQTLDRIFTEHASGKDTNRPQLQAAISYVRDGDHFVVHSMDRLARNVEDMLRIVRQLNEKGVSVQFIKENMTFSSSTNDPRAHLMFAMLGAFAQFERELIKERQREGIAIAKAKGKYKGGIPKLNAEQVARLKEKIALGVPKAAVARDFKITRETLYKYIRPNECRLPGQT